MNNTDPKKPLLQANRQTVFRVFFFSVFLFLIYQLIQILSPFFTAIMAAVTLTLVFYPLHAHMCQKLTCKTNLAAGISTGFILFIVIVPTILFLWLFMKEASALYPFVQNQLSELKITPPEMLREKFPALVLLKDKIHHFLVSWQIDPQDIILKNIDQIGTQISAYGARIVKNVFFFIFDIIIIVFCLFFCFRDGEKIVNFIVELIPMEKTHKEHIAERLDQTLSAVVRGTFITAFVQGILAGAGYAVAGVNFAVVLGFTTAFTALIPFVGAAAVWISVSIFLVIKGYILKAVLLSIWGAAVVSLVDNIMKPYLIGQKAKLPIFLLFFGILGGLQVYGFIGIIIGPLMIASVLAFAKIYKAQIHKGKGLTT